ncbi:MAG TPA: undecaprenyl-diphosphate phosphatase [Acidimicrobiia bacterium]|jgi:undecaprenyl-diphosphatase
MNEVLSAIIWGVVQGITEFLPVSSDGHLVLVPAFLGIEGPDLATTAFLHLGTLAAVIIYFRHELWGLTRIRRDPAARKLAGLLVLGTLPAFAALLVEDEVAALQASVTATAWFMILTSAVLFVGTMLRNRYRSIDDAGPVDAVLVGTAQVFAVLPGLSRSAVTITTGLGRHFRQVDAARFSFLLGIPAVAGAGLLETARLLGGEGITSADWVGVVVAGVTGYLAIGFLLRQLGRGGLLPYAIYCLIVGSAALILL